MSGSGLAWDLFISHASEDKDDLVRPLATELSRLGLRVWYDEFSLRLGDSLSASIDRGLADSHAGLVVVSPSFMAKPWPQRELAGLVAGEVGRDQLILPVWFNVSRADVLSFSPVLADRLAISATEVDPPELALRILERIRPDLHTAFQRRLAYYEAVATAERELVNPSDINFEKIRRETPIRHDTLSFDFAVRLRLMREVLLEVFGVDWRTTVDNFRKDLHPDDELEIWEYIASIYLTVVNEFGLSHAQRRELYLRLLEKIAARPGETWQLPDGAPEWERRAHALWSGTVDPLSDTFASRVTTPAWRPEGHPTDQAVASVGEAEPSAEGGA